ncbi:hypothetical protein HZC30_06495 [Candidatus Woesearchaeota archaeon]|nr:hypothetical protein [Candidatus Woesearchaeota archaeon]
MMKGECRICGNGIKLCERCNYLLKNGANEETIKKTLSDTRTNQIWDENKKVAEELANAYYDSVLNEYKKQLKKDSKENFGYNTFADGINLGLDVVLPLLDAEHLQKAKDKIKMMLKIRRK